ncbi:phage shock protein C (PspC) family protein [Marinitoga hydrogenitolerans DSM 16785]|uniref:Phage shock protein C (PspC) family protein n=1 Tax=Marinitoga hydrogenitolerans (strain DSM 16785 / JCM 12826 / AT1271) TaxID=1122195 RepID=A0A1M4WCE4_MARH1|nr:PspC domain-containing protein [Marinitoga hydrogenitolerans]SHE78820.1 phage shock protein C (PspC) family protein [Marinitoga hydrogenitolerans DSM 16785]
MKRDLYRSRKDKFLGGVCGGLAEYFDISSTLIRLLCLGLILVDGVGFLLYIIAWMIIPEKPANSSDNKKSYEQKDVFNKKVSERNNLIIGLIFLIFGAIFILNNFFPYILSFTVILGIFFLIIGIYLIVKGR